MKGRGEKGWVKLTPSAQEKTTLKKSSLLTVNPIASEVSFIVTLWIYDSHLNNARFCFIIY